MQPKLRDVAVNRNKMEKLLKITGQFVNFFRVLKNITDLCSESPGNLRKYWYGFEVSIIKSYIRVC
jgi:hypothetical protein